ncbi:metal ABC transporter solute-binding protein, Zn/Mn family [Roseospirillum parvum]|uniref:High-affinity zinc uptake system protein ZnuA n=1 Tax=Roseospirillum parvum TaxID=83401 RepID=A0A1G7ZLX0_9PROT|nr:zinc ABC transporter substrate-binding protein [Roseospirillum parvum]SDH09100.1 zinc transport system substrate-binding protein [Roseospirillum parvum]
MTSFSRRALGRFAALALFLSFSLLALPARAAEPLSVVVSILPQKWLVEAVGGDAVTVTVMVPPGASPATYEPKPGQMRALEAADLYFSIGVPFEAAWLPRLHDAAPGLAVIDMARDVKRRPIDGLPAAHDEHDHDAHDHDEHADEHEGDHEHEDHADHDQGTVIDHGDHQHVVGQPDPHVWLSPAAMRLMAATVFESLSTARPQAAPALRANLTEAVATIGAVDQAVAESLAGIERPTFMVFHPAWGYFADLYGLHQLPIEVHGNEPSPRELAQVIDTARDHRVSAVFVQAQFSQRAAEAIAGDLGISVVALDPLDPDWPATLKAAGDAFAKALGPAQ